MLVTRTNFVDVLKRLEAPGWYALDTETTGLSAYKGDRLFSIIIAQGEEAWYFNFNLYPELDTDKWLLKEHSYALNDLVFKNPALSWYLHNAKFDMHMLGVEGMELAGKVFCTYANGRLLHNDLRYYNLNFLSERWLKESKSDLVKEYADEHGLFDTVVKGKQKRKNYHFWKVPLDVVQDYAEKDGTLAYKLGEYLRENIALLDDKYRKTDQPPLMQVSENECALTKVLYEVERIGVKLDKDYCERALEDAGNTYRGAMKRFEEITGLPFDDSPTTLAKAFKVIGYEGPKGHMGRVLTNKEVLASIQHPMARAVEEYRSAYKKGITYYANFLAMCDETGTIHPDFHQGGTKTGRLSCRDPNLQNLERPDEDDADAKDAFTVRRAFVPREGFCFFAPDFDQIEYRVMLCYAQEMSVIEEVRAGKDVHQATADILRVGRYQAKTINFMLIYGGGIDKLATMLRLPWSDAKEARNNYFRELPKIAAFVERVRAAASQNLTIHNWFGRRYTFAHPDMTYTTAPNWLIQGGCADILKIAMIRVHNFLRKLGALSRIVLNVHDELVLEMHHTELHLCEEIVQIMEDVYTGQLLRLTAGPSYSWKSLADKLDGYPVMVQ